MDGLVMTTAPSAYTTPGWTVQTGPGGDNSGVSGGSSPPAVGAPVTSVNGHVGAVVLAATDVSAVATSTLGAASGVATLTSGSKLVQMPVATDIPTVVAKPTSLTGTYANPGTAAGSDAAVINAITAILVGIGVCHS
jgi:hypothetical protein